MDSFSANPPSVIAYRHLAPLTWLLGILSFVAAQRQLGTNEHAQMGLTYHASLLHLAADHYGQQCS
jgi:hypothetical protein